MEWSGISKLETLEVTYISGMCLPKHINELCLHVWAGRLTASVESVSKLKNVDVMRFYKKCNVKFPSLVGTAHYIIKSSEHFRLSFMYSYYHESDVVEIEGEFLKVGWTIAEKTCKIVEKIFCANQISELLKENHYEVAFFDSNSIDQV